MKRQLMIVACVLLLTGSAAQAEHYERLDAVETTTLANFVGSQKHNRCPRFRVIDAATKAELAAANMAGPADTPDDPSDDLLWPGTRTSMYAEEYNKDPSAFCKMAWEKLGPNGTYKRQMLEAK